MRTLVLEKYGLRSTAECGRRAGAQPSWRELSFAWLGLTRRGRSSAVVRYEVRLTEIIDHHFCDIFHLFIIVTTLSSIAVKHDGRTDGQTLIKEGRWQ